MQSGFSSLWHWLGHVPQLPGQVRACHAGHTGAAKVMGYIFAVLHIHCLIQCKARKNAGTMLTYTINHFLLTGPVVDPRYTEAFDTACAQLKAQLQTQAGSWLAGHAGEQSKGGIMAA
jgi:hypothetical protein